MTSEQLGTAIALVDAARMEIERLRAEVLTAYRKGYNDCKNDVLGACTPSMIKRIGWAK
jgi:hypothetical protein